MFKCLVSFILDLQPLPPQEDCALIVLIQDSVIVAVSLSLQELIIPYDVGHKIIHGHEFGFRGAASVQFLFVVASGWNPLYQRNASTYVSSHIGGHHGTCINNI